MKITTQELQQYIYINPGVRVRTLVQEFDVTSMTIHRHLQKLMSSGVIIKKGKTPHVQYYPAQESVSIQHTGHKPFIRRLLDQERYQISKIGEELVGVSGFEKRCKKRNQNPIESAERRSSHMQYIDSIMTPIGIDATHKLNNYPNSNLIQLLYGHIYALPEFGKTKYGTRMELAKTYPSIDLFNKLFDTNKKTLSIIVQEKKIDAVCFARPTAQRKLQIMDYASKVLLSHLPRIHIQKTPGYFPAQKTLKKREDRIANAQASFELLSSRERYKNVLIIDDAVGSGATLVEIGNKILQAGLAQTVIGYSFIGTANGIFDQVKKFEVISNV